jgi:uncharacterized protein (TIGR02466 family)
MKLNFFSSNVYYFEDTTFLKNLDSICEPYINKAIEQNKINFIGDSDIGLVHHSETLINDNNFLNFSKFIIDKSYFILDEQGYDLRDYTLFISELWVQQFAKFGGGQHESHIHWNGHISGFYFLKCSENTSYPIFHDPRPGKLMNQLPQKDKNNFTDASDLIHFKPKPGTFLFFNSYLNHQFAFDLGKEPFRFIHFNIRAFPKNINNF